MLCPAIDWFAKNHLQKEEKLGYESGIDKKCLNSPSDIKSHRVVPYPMETFCAAELFIASSDLISLDRQRMWGVRPCCMKIKKLLVNNAYNVI